MNQPRTIARAALAMVAACLVIASCTRSGQGGGTGGGIPGVSSTATGVGYVDMDKVIASHPLHNQLQAMQDQIAVLQQEATLVPTGMTEQQAAAYDQMQRELAAAADKFQQDLAARRDYYQRREAQAIGKLQAAVLGSNPDTSVLGGLQQQFGQQAQALQKQAIQTLTTYRTELFKQDNDHLKQVQALIAADAREKLKQRESQLSSAETKYQIELVKADQEQRLNLQAKLQDLALSDKDRGQYQSQLKALDANEQSKINAMKARDGAEIAALQRTLNAQAATKYDQERKATQAATQTKLMERQKEMQTAMNPQMKALSGKFQQQLNSANARLAQNEKYKSQAQALHDQMQSGYMADANRAQAQYRDVRSALVSKYSAIAHMQFQDNEAISAQADKIASDRRDLYQQIASQVSAQVAQIAQKDGIAVVFTSVRAPGTAVDLTDKVTRAITSSAGATVSPAPTISGGS